jgi:hypothetical protein
MFSLLSTSNSDRSVEYWEGWQAVELKKQCTYTDAKQRKEWARGFAAGVIEMRGFKAWYRSKTMIVGLSLLGIGVGFLVYGYYYDASGVFGAGTGITATSVLMAALRLITNTNITIGGPGGGQFTPPLQ